MTTIKTIQTKAGAVTVTRQVRDNCGKPMEAFILSGPSGEHVLWCHVTDEARLAAHVEGFVEQNGGAVPMHTSGIYSKAKPGATVKQLVRGLPIMVYDETAAQLHPRSVRSGRLQGRGSYRLARAGVSKPIMGQLGEWQRRTYFTDPAALKEQGWRELTLAEAAALRLVMRMR